MRKSFFIHLFIVINLSLHAQDLGIYDWASLQSYRSGYDVTETPNYIVYNAKSGLVFINKSNPDDVQHLTTIDGIIRFQHQQNQIYRPSRTIVDLL